LFSIRNITGRQSYRLSNGTPVTVNYSRGGTNMREATNGVGIAMNIVNASHSNLTNQMIVHLRGNSTKGRMTFFGTYQHGITNTTLANAHNFTFTGITQAGRTVMGGTISMPTDNANRFDRMGGVCGSFTRV